MAQAARLNLRMQKEVKLLLTDPPPGASFPHLSPDSDLSSFSLTAIDAQIDGPEGTVYEKGVFKIKIQIPERYPFQPPIVTFGTPIYHPNIDTGGRICLDILNLPPKGAWQPSLNISTVLTSIGLLLSEPNPDDGLMCEASKEYKYNKQVFDQKARSMTEKYARSSGSPNHGGVQLVTDPIMREDKPPEPKTDLYDYAASFKKLSGTGRKLSLDVSCSESSTKESDVGLKENTSSSISRSQIPEAKQDLKDMSFEHGKNQVLTAMNTVNDQYNKPPTISSKKLCLSSKNVQHEILNSTVLHDLDAQKENLLLVQGPKQDSKDMSSEHGKNQFLTVMNTGRDQHNKRPAISSKKLRLSSKSVQHEILDSTILHDLDAQKENMLQVQEPKQDSKDMLSKHGTVMNTDRDQYNKPPTISSKKLRLSSNKVQHELLDSTILYDLDAQKENLLQVQEPKQDSKDMSFKHGKNRVITMMNTDHNRYNKPPAISSKKLCLSSKNPEHEIFDLTVLHDAQKENISQVQEQKQDSEDMPFEHGKNQVLTMNPERDQGNKPPSIRSKKLCLSSKDSQHEILDSTVLCDVDAKKENLLQAQKKSNDGTGFTNLKRKKLGLTGKKSSFGYLAKPQNRKTDDQVQAGKKGAIPTRVMELPRKPLQVLEETHKCDVKLKANAKLLDSNVSKHGGARFNEETLEQGMCDPEGVIVLDSEDSEEEQSSSLNSRRFIARKRVLGRR